MNLIEQEKIIRKLREKGACSVELAKSLADLQVDSSKVAKRLIKNRVIKSGGGNTYFLDERELMKFRLNRVKWGMSILFLILIIILIYLTKK